MFGRHGIFIAVVYIIAPCFLVSTVAHPTVSPDRRKSSNSATSPLLPMSYSSLTGSGLVPSQMVPLPSADSLIYLVKSLLPYQVSLDLRKSYQILRTYTLSIRRVHLGAFCSDREKIQPSNTASVSLPVLRAFLQLRQVPTHSCGFWKDTWALRYNLGTFCSNREKLQPINTGFLSLSSQTVYFIPVDTVYID